MAETASSIDTGAAAEFDRPLLLTPRENLTGYVGSHVGRATLFLVTATSVVAVLLIFAFILREAAGFFIDPAALPALDATSAASVLSWAWAAVHAAGARVTRGRPTTGSTAWWAARQRPRCWVRRFSRRRRGRSCGNGSG